MTTNFVFRVDSSINIGSGHVSRCINYALYLKKLGNNVSFVCRELNGNIIHKIKLNKIKVHILNLRQNNKLKKKRNYNKFLGDTLKNDLEDTISVIKRFDKVDLLIIDHYWINYSWQKLIKNYVNKILVIEDLYNRKHYCDFLLNYNNFSNAKKIYSKLNNKNTRLLLGPKYLLLPKDYYSNYNRIDLNKIKIFIFFGHSDNNNLTIKVLRYLINIKNFNFFYNIAIGEESRKLKLIKKLFGKSKNYKIFVQTKNIKKVLLNSHLAVGSGGFNSFERIRLCVPSIVISNAANQNWVCKFLSNKKLIEYLGNEKSINKSVFENKIKELIYNYDNKINILLKKQYLFPKESMDNLHKKIMKYI